jgi:UTP--glucose-1-phosphate uridylyltransferase
VGKRHDAGDKQGFLRATVELGLKHPKLGADLRSWLRAQTF